MLFSELGPSRWEPVSTCRAYPVQEGYAKKKVSRCLAKHHSLFNVAHYDFMCLPPLPCISCFSSLFTLQPVSLINQSKVAKERASIPENETHLFLRTFVDHHHANCMLHVYTSPVDAFIRTPSFCHLLLTTAGLFRVQRGEARLRFHLHK